jgi:hypothetical protein
MSIIASSISLCFYDFSDLENLSPKNRRMMLINNIFNVIFILEAIMKLIAYGAYSSKNSYFQDRWNIFDFVLSVCAGLSMLIGNKF